MSEVVIVREAYLRDHVHAHGVSSLSGETNEKSSTCHCTLERLETSETRSRVESSLENVGTFLRVDPSLRSGALNYRRESEGRATSHGILSNDSSDTSRDVESLASSGSRSYERSFSSSHRDRENDAVDSKRSSDTDRNWHITYYVLAALSHDARVVVVEEREFRGLESLSSRCTS